jgi:hypothetical protein
MLGMRQGKSRGSSNSIAGSARPRPSRTYLFRRVRSASCYKIWFTCSRYYSFFTFSHSMARQGRACLERGERRGGRESNPVPTTSCTPDGHWASGHQRDRKWQAEGRSFYADPASGCRAFHARRHRQRSARLQCGERGRKREPNPDPDHILHARRPLCRRADPDR